MSDYAIKVVIYMALVGVAIGTIYQFANDPQPTAEVVVQATQSTVEVGKTYKATRVQVIQGHVFDIYLENGKRYLVALDGVAGTPDEAKQAVINHLNESKQSGGTFHVKFRRWDAIRSLWLADCMTMNGTEVSLIKNWLEIRLLLYEQ